MSASVAPVSVAMIGGTPHLPGGTELFCDRAAAAVTAHSRAIRLIRIPANTSYLSVRRLGAVAGTLRAMRHARRWGAQVAWVQVTNLPELGLARAARAMGYKVLVTPHLGANSRLRRSGAMRAVADALLGVADRFALLFDGQAEELELPDTVPRSVIRTFLSKASLSPPEGRRAGDTLTLIHAGRLSEAKGSARAVELAAALARAGVPVSARIIGEGDAALMARLRDAAAPLGDKIRFEGWMDEAALAQTLGEADVLVHLSAFDAYPLIVLEAMARGAFPLVYAMAGAGSIIGTYGGVALPIGAPVERGAEALVWLGVDAIRREGLRTGERVRKDFAWPAAVRALEAAVAATFRD